MVTARIVLRGEVCPAGMAELMMRHLEAESAKEQAKGLLRPKAAYEAATMLVDASHHAWKVLYIDSQASSVTGDTQQSALCLSVHLVACTLSADMYRCSWTTASLS